jgi:hypothetical protein
MREEEMKKLQPGDVVRNLATGLGYVVTGRCGAEVIATRTVSISNPQEWSLQYRSTQVPEGPGGNLADILGQMRD